MQSRSDFNSRLTLAEQQIQEGRYEAAAELLQEILADSPDCGRAQFDLGNLYRMKKEYGEAEASYCAALENGYRTSAVYHLYAGLMERKGEFDRAEQLQTQALEQAGPEERTLYMALLFRLYFRNCRNMEAERTAHRYRKEFPDDYTGCHMLFLVRLQQQELDKFIPQIEALEDKFGDLEPYWIDRMAALEYAGKYTALLALLTQNEKVMKVVPERVLEKKTKLMIQRKNYDGALACLQSLYTDYRRKDAAFSLMLYEYQNRHYQEAAVLARRILRSEKGKSNLVFYVALYCYVFLLYETADRKPDEPTRAFMKKGMDLCVEWFKSKELYTEEMEQSVNGFYEAVINRE
ncbi:MAG: tetratricopeptide repeat protein [Clostridiales bacterium]|nr:tetratricopeptide repeat protein [Clostridiales bacterium]